MYFNQQINVLTKNGKYRAQGENYEELTTLSPYTHIVCMQSITPSKNGNSPSVML